MQKLDSYPRYGPALWMHEFDWVIETCGTWKTMVVITIYHGKSTKKPHHMSMFVSNTCAHPDTVKQKNWTIFQVLPQKCVFVSQYYEIAF